MVLAMVKRLGLLAPAAWIMKTEGTLFAISGNQISGKDVILMPGGIFLICQSAAEICQKMEGAEGDRSAKARATTIKDVLIQILLPDLVFSIDSIITAVGNG